MKSIQMGIRFGLVIMILGGCFPVARADATNILMRPGLKADQQTRVITIEAVSTVPAPTDPVEFFLISSDSGHDYEALAVSKASPADLYDALTFIGMTPGQPVDYESMRFWPRGNRIAMRFEWDDSQHTNTSVHHSARVEELILDTRTGKHLPVTGLCYTGSRWVPSASNHEQQVLAADAYDPNSIASDYNEPLSLFDVPRKTLDHEVYGMLRARTEIAPPPDTPIRVVIEPLEPRGFQRAIDLTLEVEPPRHPDAGWRGFSYRLLDPQNVPVQHGNTLRHVLATFGRQTKAGHDLFITVKPSRAIRVGDLRDLYQFLAGLETENGIRLEPPPNGHLFFRAFLPAERLRNRETRPSQPPELHITPSPDGLVTGILVRLEENWPDDAERPDITPHPYAVKTPAEALKALNKFDDSLPVLLVYCPERLTYGALLDYILPMMTNHPTVYVFLPVYDPVTR